MHPVEVDTHLVDAGHVVVHGLPHPAARERGRWRGCDCLHDSNHLRGDSFRNGIEEDLRGNGLGVVIVRVALEELDRPRSLSCGHASSSHAVALVSKRSTECLRARPRSVNLIAKVVALELGDDVNESSVRGLCMLDGEASQRRLDALDEPVVFPDRVVVVISLPVASVIVVASPLCCPAGPRQ